MLTHPTIPQRLTNRLAINRRERVEGATITQVSVVLLDGIEQFTIHGERWGTDLQVYSRGRCVTGDVPTHLDSHDAVLTWAVRRIELGYIDRRIA